MPQTGSHERTTIAYGGMYDRARYQFSRAEPSYWEAITPSLPHEPAPLAGDTQTEIAIIGGGYAGLSAALHLAEAGISCRVLEAGPIGWGASGRNGGFVCLGASFLSPGDIARRHGEDAARGFVKLQCEAIDLVDGLTRDGGPHIGKGADGILVIAHAARRIKELANEGDELRALGGVGSTWIAPGQLAEAGYEANATQHGGLLLHRGFSLNPLAYVRHLAGKALEAGAVLHARSEVLSWRRESGGHVLATAGGRLHARQVIVACNGFMPEHLHPALTGRVLPVQSNIAVTAQGDVPPEGLARVAGSNTRDLLWYFRQMTDGRLLLGGRGDTTGTARAGTRMRRKLEAGLAEVFGARRAHQTAYFWRGFIAVTSNFLPAIGSLKEDATVHYAFGCHGNGVALMSWAGRALAQRIAGKVGALPHAVSLWPRAFPRSGFMRRQTLRLALLRAAIRDRFS
ncbi:MAG TPA: FAD-dependent oxidoreductase [Micropepsaceae bacterium]|nr:FAD-dependent oxidoreductase [Micropepsaceae bacterium]